MVTTRGWRLAGLAGIALALAVTATACSSGSPKAAADSSHQLALARQADASALLAQCAITQGVQQVITSARQHSSGLPPAQQWLQAGQIVVTKNNYATFHGWYAGYAAGIVAAGKSLDRWGVSAAESDKLPVALCGTGTSARSLHDQVYAHDPPLLKNNPWGS